MPKVRLSVAHILCTTVHVAMNVTVIGLAPRVGVYTCTFTAVYVYTHVPYLPMCDVSACIIHVLQDIFEGLPLCD